MNKPNRKPDYVSYNGNKYWFKEMLMETKLLGNLKLKVRDNEILVCYTKEKEEPLLDAVYKAYEEWLKLYSILSYEEKIKKVKSDREAAHIFYDDAMEDFIKIADQLNKKEIKQCQEMFGRIRDLDLERWYA